MKILVVEDEDGLRDMVRESLEKEKYIVECASDYQTALTKVQEYDYDCVLLDIMLPGGSGLGILSALKRLRKQERVIILSAKDSVDDKIKCLDMGADDYLAKPFHLAELHARIKSLLRRKNAHGDTSIILENLVVYPDKRQVMVGDTEIQLNRKEFDLLYYFVSNPNRLINKTSLAESVWGDHIDQADSLDFLYSQVKNLRKKMKQVGAVPEIKAVYGFGYKLIV